MSNFLINGLDKIKRPIYLTTFFLIYLIYGLVFAHIIPSTPKLVYYLTEFIQLFVCLVLLIKFHPFREKYELKDFDGEIIFGSALIILTNQGFTGLMIDSLSKIENTAMNGLEKWQNNIL